MVAQANSHPSDTPPCVRPVCPPLRVVQLNHQYPRLNLTPVTVRGIWIQSLASPQHDFSLKFFPPVAVIAL